MDMDAWDITILVVASYVAVMALIRMMSVHRRNVTKKLQKQIANEQRRRREEEAKQQDSNRRGAA